MRTSLAVRLTLAFLLVALTATFLVAVLIRFLSAGQFNQLVVEQARIQFADQVATFYTTNGSLDGITSYIRQGMPMTMTGNSNAPGRHEGMPGQGEMRRDRAGLFGLADQNGHMLVPISSYSLGQTVPGKVLAKSYPVEVDGETIAFVLTDNIPPSLLPEEQAFLTRTNRALLVAAVGALLLAVIMGILLARTLTQPLRRMTFAARQIAAGKLDQQVDVTSKDELGELAEAFNQMSHDLTHANALRRRMTADIAHELRTPLTVISGYIESMQDGVLDSTPQRLAILAQEVDHLQHLVNDLHTLSKADSGDLVLYPQKIAPLVILERAAAAFRVEAERKGVALQVAAGSDLPFVSVDEERLAQVMNNLVSNALRHTPEGGSIELSAEASGQGVQIKVRDTGEGISVEDLPHIFERLYRADPSRQQDNGESGLGLAITKALVEAHGGSITAASDPGISTMFTLWLPAAGE